MVALILLLGRGLDDAVFVIGNFEVLSSDTMVVDRTIANKCSATTMRPSVIDAIRLHRGLITQGSVGSGDCVCGATLA